MSDQRESSLTFALEETVWFQKGQEVDELISISLDPHISILEEADYVVLNGTLALSGEYRHLSSEEEADEPFGSMKKYIQSAEARNEEESLFSHQFPVNITIPRRRVPDPERLVIEVQSFDYHLPEADRLTIEADVDIFGLAADAAEKDAPAAEENPSAKGEEPAYAAEDDGGQAAEPESAEREEELAEIALEFEEETAAKEEEAKEVKEAEEEREEVFLEAPKHDPAAEFGLEEAAEPEVIEAEAELYEPFFAESRRIPKDEAELRKEFDKLQKLIPQLPEFAMEALAELTREFAPQPLQQPSSSLYEPESSSLLFAEAEPESSSSPEEKVKKKKDKYQSMSFADFFARKEEEASTMLRLCLVQNGDTLDRLADRYKVSPQQILRANRLDPSADVHEGQVIYIPAKTQQRK